MSLSVEQEKIGPQFEVPKGFKLVKSNTEYQICESEYIPNLMTFQRKYFEDIRGGFDELMRFDPVAEFIGRNFEAKQLSFTFNLEGSMRAMHAEPIDKCVAAITGKGMMAWTDIRVDSSGFGRTSVIEFDYSAYPEAARISVWVPQGVANGVMFTDVGYYIYVVSGIYTGSQGKRAFRWNDPDAAIPWPGRPTRMSKDDESNHPFLRQMFPNKFK